MIFSLGIVSLARTAESRRKACGPSTGFHGYSTVEVVRPVQSSRPGLNR
jgi:hypothetical protein